MAETVTDDVEMDPRRAARLLRSLAELVPFGVADAAGALVAGAPLPVVGIPSRTP